MTAAPDKPDNNDDLPSIEEFGERLRQSRGEEPTVEPKDGTMLGWGMRIASELLAALLVACLLGWGIDYVFGTKPWFLIAGVFLGFAAGLLNVMRASKQMDNGLE